jgi:hypothetical protein
MRKAWLLQGVASASSRPSPPAEYISTQTTATRKMMMTAGEVRKAARYERQESVHNSPAGAPGPWSGVGGAAASGGQTSSLPTMPWRPPLPSAPAPPPVAWGHGPVGGGVALPAPPPVAWGHGPGAGGAMVPFAASAASDQGRRLSGMTAASRRAEFGTKKGLDCVVDEQRQRVTFTRRARRVPPGGGRTSVAGHLSFAAALPATLSDAHSLAIRKQLHRAHA